MKSMITIFLFTISFISNASSEASKTFIYNGSINSVEIVLSSFKTHTEYKLEESLASCKRSERVGYRSICTGPGSRTSFYPGLYNNPRTLYRGPHIHNGGYLRQCFSEPIYRELYFPCTSTSKIPFQVKDYDVEARVIVDVTNSSNLATPGENLTVSVRGDDLSFTASGSKKFFIVSKNQDVRSAMSGSTKVIDALYAVELVEAVPFLASVNVVNLEVVDSILRVKFNSAQEARGFGVWLKIDEKKLLSSDKKVYERELSANEFVINKVGSQYEASVDLDKIGVRLADGKFSITTKIVPSADATLKNFSQFSDVLPSRTLIYKAR